MRKLFLTKPTLRNLLEKILQCFHVGLANVELNSFGEKHEKVLEINVFRWSANTLIRLKDWKILKIALSLNNLSLLIEKTVSLSHKIL